MAIDGAPIGYLEDYVMAGSGENARIGILFVHGFTGSPSSMRPWAEFFNEKGYAVRVPRLPGHGTRWQDLNEVSWQEWPSRAALDFLELKKTCDQVFIFGLSMGGGTTLNVAAQYGDEIAGLVLVNPMIHMPGIKAKFAPVASRFRTHLTTVGNDIKRADVSEYGYDALPMRGVVQLGKLLKNSRSTLKGIHNPLLLFHSTEDHVLPVSNTEIIFNEIGSTQKERIELGNSYHVATLDYDADIIFDKSLEFVRSLLPNPHLT